MRRLVVSVIAATSASHADVHYGGSVGGRATDLGGQIRSARTANLGVAGVVAVDLAPSWQIVVEPGLRRAGSDKYRLSYAALPVLARYRHPNAMRASAGFMASALLASQFMAPDDDGDVAVDIETVRAWDLAVVVGLGFEQGPWFGELRWSRGLATIHAQEPGLFIVNTELGLWIGVVR